MRFARLRWVEKEADIHIWVDDGFDKHDADLVVAALSAIAKAEHRMSEKDRRHYEFSDETYTLLEKTE